MRDSPSWKTVPTVGGFADAQPLSQPGSYLVQHFTIGDFRIQVAIVHLCVASSAHCFRHFAESHATRTRLWARGWSTTPAEVVTEQQPVDPCRHSQSPILNAPTSRKKAQMWHENTPKLPVQMHHNLQIATKACVTSTLWNCSIYCILLSGSETCVCALRFPTQTAEHSVFLSSDPWTTAP